MRNGYAFYLLSLLCCLGWLAFTGSSVSAQVGCNISFILDIEQPSRDQPGYPDNGVVGGQVIGANGSIALSVGQTQIAVTRSGAFRTEFVGPGIYRLVARDTEGCVADTIIVLSADCDMDFSVEVTKETVPPGNNGSARLTIIGGTPPFRVNLRDQLRNTSERVIVFDNLPAGLYELAIGDSEDCFRLGEVLIERNCTGIGEARINGLNGGPYCLTSTAPISITGNPRNGVFQGAGITNGNAGEAVFRPSAAGSGTHTILYTGTDAQGCAFSGSTIVLVLAECCPIPRTIITEVQNTTTAQVSWEAVTAPGGPILGYEVRFSPEGRDEWTTLFTQTNSATLLLPSGVASRWKVQVRTICEEEVSSDWSPDVIFETGTEPCLPPTDVNVFNIEEFAVSVSWTGVTNAASYRIEYRDRESANWIPLTAPASPTNFVLANLNRASSYFIRIISICRDGQSSEPSPPLPFRTLGVDQCLPPGVLAIGEVGETTIKLSWEAVGGSSRYIVRYRVKGSNATFQVLTTTETNLELTSLTPGTTYDIEVVTECGSVTSEPSIRREATTKDLTPKCDTPTGVAITNITEDFARVSWTKSAGAINYEIRYAVVGSGEWTVRFSASPPFNLLNLRPRTRYEVQVKGLCGPGFESPRTAPVVFETPRSERCFAPQTIRVVNVSPTTALVSWSAIDNAISYLVRYRVAKTTNWTVIQDIAALEAELTGLKPATNYEFQVGTKCDNDKTSTYTKSEPFETLVLICEAPVFTLSSITPTEATVEWPAADNAIGYTLRWRTRPNGAFITVELTETQYRITGLTSDTEYGIEIRTKCTPEINSNFGPEISFRTQAIAPNCNAPAGITSANITSATVDLSWTASANATQYIVEYRRITDLDWTAVTTSQTTLTLQGLQAGTRYLFRIRTECPGGSSPDSPQRDFTTTDAGSDCTPWTQIASNGASTFIVEDVAQRNGLVAIAGYYDTSAKLGAITLTSNGGSDGFVALLDNDGNYLWAQSIGGPENETSTSVAIDATGNVYVTGYFRELCGFSPSPSDIVPAQGVTTDAYVAKYDMNGAFVWVNTVGSPSAQIPPDPNFPDTTNIAYDVTVDAFDNVYVAGAYVADANFSTTFGLGIVENSRSALFSDAFLVKYDSNGLLEYIKTGGSTFIDVATAVKTDASGFVYLTGYYSESSTFDGNPLTTTDPATLNVFFAKYTDDGFLLGVAGAGGSGNEIPYDLVVDNSENVYITGTYDQNFVTPAGTLNASGNDDIFVIKLNAAGNPQWAVSLGGTQNDLSRQLALDPDGTLMVAGAFAGTANFGSLSRTTLGRIDAFSARLNTASGAVINVDAYGAADQFVAAFGMDIAPNGDRYLAGFFTGAVSFSGPPVFAPLGVEGFVAKFCGTTAGPCGASDLVLSTEITRTGAKISWNPAENAALYIIRYRIEGQSAWTTLDPVVSSPLVLTELTPESRYELQIRTVCESGRESEFTTPEIFTTLGNCQAPVHIFADYITATTAELSWEPTAGTVQYEVYYKRVLDLGPHTRRIVVDTFVAIAGLLPNVRYEFYVRAQCDVDEFSPTTPKVAFWTLTGACQGPSTNLTVTQVDLTTAFVRWDATFGARDYDLQWRPVGTRNWVGTIVSATQLRLTNLLPGTLYEVRVRTVCGGPRNQSPYRRPVEFTTLSRCPEPGAVSVVDSTGSTFLLSWAAVEGATGYDLFYRRKGDIDWMSVMNIQTNGTTLTGLNQITRYELSLRARCSNGTQSGLGPITEGITTRFCNRPTFITVDNVAVTTAEVTWAAVTGAIGYELQYISLEDDQWTTIMLPANRTAETLIRLLPSTQYDVRVRALCEQNSTSEFLMTNFGTDICGTASTIEILSTTPTQIWVQWTPVPGVVEYYLEYRKVGATAWQEILVIDETIYSINDLTPGTDYEVRLVVDCITGKGRPTETLYTSTRQGCVPPYQITSTVTSVTATLNWTPSVGATGYWVYWRAPLFTEVLDSAFVTGTSLTLNNLMIGQKYEARIRTVCDNGLSAVSLFHDFETDNNQGCRTPANFRATPQARTITLNWTREPGAVRYAISWRRTASFASWSTLTVNDPSLETQVLNNLVADAEYLVRIRSICSSNFSEWAQVMVRTLASRDDVAGMPEEAVRWSVYPNPTRGPLTVSVPAAGGTTRIQVVDMAGRLVHTAQQPHADYEAFDWNLTLPQLPAGLYLIRLERGFAETRTKLWVE